MSFFSRVIRFLFWLLILSWSVALLRRVVRWMLQSSAGEPSPTPDVAGSSGAVGMARRLVRDPVCGVHVAEVLAVPLRDHGELLHFCSNGCRDQYLLAHPDKNTNKIAANG